MSIIIARMQDPAIKGDFSFMKWSFGRFKKG
jgi:hypothetical protein